MLPFQIFPLKKDRNSTNKRRAFDTKDQKKVLNDRGILPVSRHKSMK